MSVRAYLANPLDEADLRDLIAKLEDPVTDLAGLTEADVETADQVVAVLVAHPELLQRPVLVRGDHAIIGRPKDRVAAFLAG